MPHSFSISKALSAFILFVLTGASLVFPAIPPEASALPTARTVTLTPENLGAVSKAKPHARLDTRNTARVSHSTYALYARFPRLLPRAGESIRSIELQLHVTAVTPKRKASLSVMATSRKWSSQRLTYAKAPKATIFELASANSLKAKEPAAVGLKLSQTSKRLAKGISLRVTNRVPRSTIRVSTMGATAPRLVITLEPAKKPAPSQGKLVFAHYFPPYPISFDNAVPSSDYYSRHYLKPDGEGGKYAAVGGLLRDRPLARVRHATNWRIANMKSEVRDAIAAGIDGFAVDILSTSGQNWDRTVELMQAASEVSPDFKIMLQPDTTSSAGRLKPAGLATALAKLAAHKSAYRLKDGRLAVSPFAPEKNPPRYWSDVLRVLKSKYRIPATLLPLFLDASKMNKFAGISYGFGNWGVRDPRAITAARNWAAQAHSLGKLWMQPVSIQDVRPNQRIFDEAGNTEALRASWTKAISEGADMVLLTTWNDYSESTSFAPSTNHGYSFLDISKFYVENFKKGQPPQIRRDALYLTHRIHPYSALPNYAGIMRQRSAVNRIAPRDTLEVLSFLTDPATIHVTTDSETFVYQAPAGIYAKKFPLQIGYSSATVRRNGVATVKVKTKDKVRATIDQQDLSYHGVSSTGR